MDDAVVVGSGPNGLAAAVELARNGASVRVVEARDEIGGGTRTAALTLPGFAHDVCSGCHPMGVLSPFFRRLPLDAHGLRWIHPPASVAHPLDDQPAVLLRRALDDTAAELDQDAEAYRTLFAPFLGQPHDLLADLLGPLRLPRHPLLVARFGVRGVLPATVWLRARFRGARARAALAGCAAHSILPLERPLTAAVGMIFALTAHVTDWPVAAGGSQAITRALASYLQQLGGRIDTGIHVRRLKHIPPARVVVFDTSPSQLADICAPLLPARYVRRLRRYRYGPGTFKLDWALDGPIPWRDPRCLEASTVHVGGTLAEIAAAEAAVWRGEHPQRPFVLVVQQSQFDPGRAPAGKHTGYAYCHVPAASNVDCTAAIEQQIERFAPGFRDRILARHRTLPADFERENPNDVGGAITGGVSDLFQFFTRPVARLDPYATPHPRLFICSASTPPGGGVHGMCGYFAARSARRRLGRLPAGLPPL
jgi:phytoene dehydrogenase-like protein